MAQTILVTGAASGIGKACAERLLGDGAHVLAFDRNDDAIAAALPRRPALAAFAGDVAHAGDCAAAVAAAVTRFGALDAVIHCAAVHSSRYWTELDADELNRVLAVNVTGSFLIAQAAGRHLVARGHGAIVLTSSSNVIVGGIGGEAGMGGPAYVASKAAVIGLVRSLARALGPSGVRVNGIAPGVTDTPMIAGYSAAHRTAQGARVPLGAIASPADIADVACFLISPQARYMAGEVVIVNGGANFG